MRRLTTPVALLGAAAIVACEQPVAPVLEVPPIFGFGNGAPSGEHYNLNIIGVPQSKTADMTGNSGHRIFVQLSGQTKILLCESGVGTACASVDGFQVLDANGTDGSASFALPDPDPDADGTTVYSVFVRALGKPGGSATNRTCGVAADNPADTICSVVLLNLERMKGKSSFRNVSRELLFVFADVNGDGIEDRVPLFSDALNGFFWQYDNLGLKLAQFRFYPCDTNVLIDPPTCS